MRHHLVLGCLVTLLSTTGTHVLVGQTDTVTRDSSGQVAGAPVTIGGRVLFTVPVRLLELGPAERAALIADRIRLAAGRVVGADSLAVVPRPDGVDIMADTLIIMTVTSGDTVPTGLSPEATARAYAATIRTAIDDLQQSRSLKSIAIGVILSIVTIVALVLLLKLYARVFPRLSARCDSWRGTVIPSLRIQRFEILPADRLTDLLIGVVKAAHVAAVVVTLYFAVPLILSFFPWTRAYSTRIVHWVKTPLARMWNNVVDYLPNAFFLVVLVVVTYYFLKFVRIMFEEVRKGTITLKGFHVEWIDPTYKIVRFLVIAFAVVLAFPYLPGSGSDAFKGVSLFLGVLFSLGSSSAIANVVAGVILTYTRAFEVGDRVQIAATVGDVTAKSLLATHVRTIKNVDVTIPNAQVLGSHIINYSVEAGATGLILHTAVTIGYDAPWRRVHELLIGAAAKTEHIETEPAPFVLQTSLDDFYVTYELNATTRHPARMAVTYSTLHQNIQDAFNEAGVEIMSPHYRSLRDGNDVTIPVPQRPQSYRAPAFRVTDAPSGGTR